MSFMYIFVVLTIRAIFWGCLLMKMVDQAAAESSVSAAGLVRFAPFPLRNL